MDRFDEQPPHDTEAGVTQPADTQPVDMSDFIVLPQDFGTLPPPHDMAAGIQTLLHRSSRMLRDGRAQRLLDLDSLVEGSQHYDTGLPALPYKHHDRYDPDSVPKILYEQELSAGHELHVPANANAMIRLRTGQEGALSTGDLTGSTAVGGLALYADGRREAYVSHYTPDIDLNDEEVGSDGTPAVVTSRLMRMFTVQATNNPGLRRLAFVVARFSGLRPQYLQDPSDAHAVNVGATVTTDVVRTGTHLTMTHNAKVKTASYTVSDEGNASLTVHVRPDGTAGMYVNDTQIHKF